MIGLRSWLAHVILDRRVTPTRRKLRRGPEPVPAYRQWIRTFPCAACGQCCDIEAAHTGARGLSTKSSDRCCIPLCAACHRTGKNALHRLGPVNFQRTWNLSFKKLVAELNRQWGQR